MNSNLVGRCGKPCIIWHVKGRLPTPALWFRTCLPNPVQVVLTGWKQNDVSLLRTIIHYILYIYIYIMASQSSYWKLIYFAWAIYASPWPRTCLLHPITNAGQSSVSRPLDDQATATSGEIGELFGIGRWNRVRICALKISVGFSVCLLWCSCDYILWSG